MKKLLLIIALLISTQITFAMGVNVTSDKIILNKDADADVAITITLILGSGDKVSLDWGDGTVTPCVGPFSFTAFNHTYAGTSSDYAITLTGDFDTLNALKVENEPVSGELFYMLDASPAFTYFYVDRTSITGDLTDLRPIKSTLQFLYVHTTAITGDFSDVADYNFRQFYAYSTPITGTTEAMVNWINMDYVSVSGMGITGDIADLATWNTGLMYMYIVGNTALTYTQGTLPNWDTADLYVSNCGLSQQEVDDFLCDVDAASVASTKVLFIDGASNAAPSATGLACKASLQGKGWTVTTN